MSEATEVPMPMVCVDCGGSLTDDDAIWSPGIGVLTHINYSQCITSLNERLTAATQRAEAAEAERKEALTSLDKSRAFKNGLLVERNALRDENDGMHMTNLRIVRELAEARAEREALLVVNGDLARDNEKLCEECEALRKSFKKERNARVSAEYDRKQHDKLLLMVMKARTMRRKLKEDAARLDWLESQEVFRASFYPLCFPPCWVVEASEVTSGETLRVAIDAAMAVQSTTGESK